jgi:hypothetical protein
MSTDNIPVNTTLLPPGGSCCLGRHVPAHVCHLQVLFSVNNYSIMYLAVPVIITQKDAAKYEYDQKYLTQENRPYEFCVTRFLSVNRYE